MVETSEGEVTGVLRQYQLSDKKPHRPSVLVVETESGEIIVRAWLAIATHEQFSHFWTEKGKVCEIV